MNNQKSQEKAIRFWLDCAKDNLVAAKAMLKAGRWSLCMFMCQQTVEALFKAAVINCTGKRPPYIHELGLLLRVTGLEAPSQIISSVKEIDKHYIKTRYKEDRFDVKVYNKKSAYSLIQQSKKVIEWCTREANLEL